MNVSTQRLVDRFLGVLGCAVLTMVRKSLRERTTNRPHRILIIKLAEQGATVLAWPAIQRAIRMVGRQNVFFLVFEENRFILDAMEALPPENIVTIPTTGIVAMIRGIVGALRRLRQERIDSAVDMEFFARSSAIMAYLSGAARRAGLHSFSTEGPWRGNLMTHRLSCNPFLHVSQVFDMLVQSLELDYRELPTLPFPPPPIEHALPRFTPHAEECAQMRATLGSDGPWVLLNANASDLLPLRRWESCRYVELAQWLLRDFPSINIAFTGGPSEAEAVEPLVRQVGSARCVSLAGRTSLRQLMVLYTLAETLVTNDSGPAHFATLTPIDVVTLFGPETPVVFGSQSPQSHLLWAGLACSPCVNAFNNRLSFCRDNRCMRKISVEHVADTVKRILERRLKKEAEKHAVAQESR